MQKLAAILALFLAVCVPGTALAQEPVGYQGGVRTVSTTSWVEEWDAVAQRWVRVPESELDQPANAVIIETVTTHVVNGKVVSQVTQPAQAAPFAARYAVPMHAAVPYEAMAQYGPFRVIDGKRAAMVGSTDELSPAHLGAMLRDFPELEELEMIDAPGTSNDIANLEVGRMIRAAGLRTHVPNGGSVRSGAVELFLAGVTRTMDAGAMFAVHSWLDNYGREADDFAPNDPAHRLYLDYYTEMGMSETRAQEFYAMTNSVPHAGALWLRAEDMRGWIAADSATAIRSDGDEAASIWAEQEQPVPVPSIEVSVIADVAGLAIPSIQYADLDAVALARVVPVWLDS